MWHFCYYKYFFTPIKSVISRRLCYISTYPITTQNRTLSRRQNSSLLIQSWLTIPLEKQIFQNLYKTIKTLDRQSWPYKRKFKSFNFQFFFKLNNMNCINFNIVSFTKINKTTVTQLLSIFTKFIVCRLLYAVW